MDAEDRVAAAVLVSKVAELRELELKQARTLSQVRAELQAAELELAVRTRPIMEDGE